MRRVSETIALFLCGSFLCIAAEAALISAAVTPCVAASDGSEIFGGGLWRTFTYDKPSAEPIVFSGESRCEGVTEGQYCIYLDLWYDDGTPVWG